jgi:hypothetical protein
MTTKPLAGRGGISLARGVPPYKRQAIVRLESNPMIRQFRLEETGQRASDHSCIDRLKNLIEGHPLALQRLGEG